MVERGERGCCNWTILLPGCWWSRPPGHVAANAESSSCLVNGKATHHCITGSLLFIHIIVYGCVAAGVCIGQRIGVRTRLSCQLANLLVQHLTQQPASVTTTANSPLAAAVVNLTSTSCVARKRRPGAVVPPRSLRWAYPRHRVQNRRPANMPPAHTLAPCPGATSRRSGNLTLLSGGIISNMDIERYVADFRVTSVLAACIAHGYGNACVAGTHGSGVVRSESSRVVTHRCQEHPLPTTCAVKSTNNIYLRVARSGACCIAGASQPVRTPVTPARQPA